MAEIRFGRSFRGAQVALASTCLAFGLAACGGSDGSPSDDGSSGLSDEDVQHISDVHDYLVQQALLAEERAVSSADLGVARTPDPGMPFSSPVPSSQSFTFSGFQDHAYSLYSATVLQTKDGGWPEMFCVYEVPDTPAYLGQAIYPWCGIQDTGGRWVVQPVLFFGGTCTADHDPSGWEYVSVYDYETPPKTPAEKAADKWGNECVLGTPVVPVSPGDKVTALLRYSSKLGGWQIYTAPLDNKEHHSYVFADHPPGSPEVSWLDYETLTYEVVVETYSISTVKTYEWPHAPFKIWAMGFEGSYDVGDLVHSSPENVFPLVGCTDTTPAVDGPPWRQCTFTPPPP